MYFIFLRTAYWVTISFAAIAYAMDGEVNCPKQRRYWVKEGNGYRLRVEDIIQSPITSQHKNFFNYGR